MTNYPTNVDTDAELPRVDDNITETGAESLNAMREAIFAIEEAIGINPQGATANLVNRLAKSINQDGTLKASALVAAGLIALPIVNSQVSATAAIEEAKLDLDVATQNLQDQIASNDVDIAELQKLLSQLLADFSRHFDGTGLRHDTFDIDLNSAFPSSTPPEFPGLTSSELHGALVEMNDRFIDHASTGKVGAHQASNISVDGTNFQTISIAVDDAQEALEALDRARAIEFEIHRDEMHANGFSNWANDIDGYNTNLQKEPSTLGNTSSGEIVSGLRNVFQFTSGAGLGGLGITQGDVLVITEGGALGNYTIDDLGPRSSVGLKPALDGYQLEIVGTFPDGYDGYANTTQAAIFGASSVFTLRGNGAPSVHQISDRVDSLQVARPNAARAVSLGIRPQLLTASETLVVRAGTGSGTSRTVTVDNLVVNRSGIPASPITVDSVVERINSVFQNPTDGYAFPAAAYRLGDELMLAHNWYQDNNNTLEILSSGTGNFLLGFDGYGADVVDSALRPTSTAYFYVNGKQHNDYARMVLTTATVTGPSSTIVTLDGVNPLDAGVKIGHLLHLKTHTTSSVIGTYIITNVTSTAVTVHSAILAGSGLEVEILHDALPLHDFRNNTRDVVVEAFIDSSARLGYNERLSYTDSIINMTILDVSDNFVAVEHTLVVGSTTSSRTYQLDNGKVESRPLGFSGRLDVFSPDNIEFITLDLTSPVGTGTTDVVINQHIDEEEVLEICSARINGLITVSNIVDKRLFGSTGLDELREDVVQAYVETPLRDLRSNGIVEGFEVLQDGYVDAALFPDNHGLIVRGGTAYIDGARCLIPTESVIIPNTGSSTTYTIALNALGTYQIIDVAEFTIAELLDGYGGELALIAKVDHDGFNITNVEDLRFFINDLDDKVELVLDLTNHMVGQFATVDAAINYANNYPSSEKFRIRVVSRTGDNITIPAGSRDITLDIDGYVGSITANSKFKLTSESCTERGAGHVSGDINVAAGCLLADIENVTLDGYVIFDGTTAQAGIFNKVTFTGTTSTILVNDTVADRLVVNDCRFLSGHSGITASNVRSVRISRSEFQSGNITMSAGNDELFVENCLLSETFIATGTNATINHSRFTNYSLPSLPLVDATIFAARISMNGCTFDNITVDGINSVIGDGASRDMTARGCVFDEITMSGTATIFNTPFSGIIKGSTFGANTYPAASRSVICGDFTENSNDGFSGGDVIIACSNTFKDNIDFHSVTTESSTLRLVENNTFTVGVGVITNLDLSALAAGEECIVSGNYFFTDDFAGTKSCILCGTNTSGITIMGNFIRGTTGNGGTSVGIALADATGGTFIIVGNQFSALDTPITNTDPIPNLIITNNDFGITGFTLIAGDGLNLSSNIFSTATTAIGTTAMSDARIENNLLNSTAILNITAPLTDSLIFGNVGNQITIGAACTNTVISSNFCDFDVTSGGTNFSLVSFTENMTDISNLNRIDWQNSIISENIFSNSGLMEFTLEDVGGDALTTIAKNIFDTNIELSASSSTIDKIDFSDNISLSNTNTFTVNDTLNNSFITKNIQFSIDLSSGANSSIVSINNSPEQAITLSGNVNSTTINGNFCGTLVGGDPGLIIDCNSTGDLTILNNIIFGSLDVFSTSPGGTFSIINASISNNAMVEDIRIGDGIVQDDILIFTNNTISNNKARDLLVYATIPGTLGTTTLDFSDNTVSNNSFRDFEIFDGASTYADIITFDSNIITGNKIAQNIDIQTNGSLAIPFSTFNDNTITNNLITLDIIISGAIELEGLQLNGNLCRRITRFVSADALTDERLVITNNVVTESCTFFVSSPASGFTAFDTVIFSNNIMENGDFLVTLNAGGAVSTNLEMNKWSVKNNIMRAFVVEATTPGTGATVDIAGVSIDGNLFFGDTALVAVTNWEPGVYFSKGSTNIVYGLTSVSISNNYVAEDYSTLPDTQIAFANPGFGTINMDNITISNNRGHDITFNGNNTLNCNDCAILNNGWSTDAGATTSGVRLINSLASGTGGTFQNLIIQGNYGGAEINLDGANGITNMSITNNFLGGGTGVADTGALLITNQKDDISFVSIIGNRIEQLRLSGDTGSFSALSSCIISSNDSGLLTVDDFNDNGAPALSVSGMLVSDNRFADSGATDQGTISFRNAARLSTIQINGNKIFSGILLDGSSTGSVQYADIMGNALLDDAGSGGGGESIAVNNMVNITALKILNNTTGALSDINIDTTGTGGIVGLTIGSNFGFDTTIDCTNDDVSNFHYTNNVGDFGLVIICNGLFNSKMIGNSSGGSTWDFSGVRTMNTVAIIGNSITSLNLDVIVSITRLEMSHNHMISGVILPTETFFISVGNSQSKICNNYAFNWEATGVGIAVATNDQRIFMMGNHGSSAVTGTFTITGAGQNDTQAQNNLAGNILA